jgi:hypothetical protein
LLSISSVITASKYRRKEASWITPGKLIISSMLEWDGRLVSENEKVKINKVSEGEAGLPNSAGGYKNGV